MDRNIIGTAIGKHDYLNHVGLAPHFPFRCGLQRLLNARLYPDTDNARFAVGLDVRHKGPCVRIASRLRAYNTVELVSYRQRRTTVSLSETPATSTVD